MKTLLASVMVLASASAFSIDGMLDGMSYCRTIKSTGMFGQPAGIRQHCITFKGGVATDNSSTFFGNPPERFSYDVVNKKIINVNENKATEYVLKDMNTIIYGGKTVMKRLSL